MQQIVAKRVTTKRVTIIAQSEGLPQKSPRMRSLQTRGQRTRSLRIIYRQRRLFRTPITATHMSTSALALSGRHTMSAQMFLRSMATTTLGARPRQREVTRGITAIQQGKRLAILEAQVSMWLVSSGAAIGVCLLKQNLRSCKMVANGNGIL